MRKIFAFIAVSVDGYHAGPNQELDWQNLDEEFDAFSAEQLTAKSGRSSSGLPETHTRGRRQPLSAAASMTRGFSQTKTSVSAGSRQVKRCRSRSVKWVSRLAWGAFAEQAYRRLLALRMRVRT